MRRIANVCNAEYPPSAERNGQEGLLKNDANVIDENKDDSCPPYLVFATTHNYGIPKETQGRCKRAPWRPTDRTRVIQLATKSFEIPTYPNVLTAESQHVQQEKTMSGPEKVDSFLENESASLAAEISDDPSSDYSYQASEDSSVGEDAANKLNLPDLDLVTEEKGNIAHQCGETASKTNYDRTPEPRSPSAEKVTEDLDPSVSIAPSYYQIVNSQGEIMTDLQLVHHLLVVRLSACYRPYIGPGLIKNASSPPSLIILN